MRAQFRIIWLIVLILGSTFIFGTIGPIVSAQREMARLQEQIESAAVTSTVAVAQSLDREVKSGDWEAVQNRLRRLNALAIKSRFRIVTTDGAVLADSQRIVPSGRRDQPIIAQALANKTYAIGYEEAPTRIFVAIPLTGQPDLALLNEVDIEADLADVVDNINQSVQLRLLLVLVLAIAVMAVMWRLLVRPLQQLRLLAQAVSGGAHDQRVPVMPVLEMQQLGLALNQMLDRNAEQRAALEHLNDSLERTVRQRTAELERSNEELRKLSLVASKTMTSVIITDAHGTIEWVNDGFTRMSGYTLEEVCGKRPAEVLQGPLTDQRAIQYMIETVMGGQNFIGEILNYREDGTTYWTEMNITPIFDENGAIIRLISIDSDITERKNVERLKSEFVSVVSHELRTPLTSIRGALGLIAGGMVGELPAKARDMIEIALKNSERLVRLINDILDIEKIESGRMTFDLKPIDLLPLIEQTIAANQHYAAQYHVRFTIRETTPEARVMADADRLTQVLTNLLSNAAKFSPCDDVVEIVVRRHNEGICVAIADHGPGIPEAFRDQIFQKFAQADSSDTRQKGGTGLGLSIAKAIVEKHGGQIGFETAIGAGTTFYFELPAWQ